MSFLGEKGGEKLETILQDVNLKEMLRESGGNLRNLKKNKSKTKSRGVLPPDVS